MRLDHAHTQAVNASISRETRHETRFDVVVPCECYPVTGLGQVDSNPLLLGFIQDASPSGLGICTEAPKPEWLESILVCIDADGPNRRFCPVVIERSESIGERHHWGCLVGGPLLPIFCADTWYPKFGSERMTYEMPFDPAIWMSLEAVGAVRRESLDYVAVCPDCDSLVNARWGCPHCLSAHLEFSRMIHHYACAHVDLTEQYSQGDSIRCPKCQTRNLIVGADFEYLDGPTTCADCRQSILEPCPVAHCLGCGRRSLMNETASLEIVSHHVRRFEPMELVAQR